MSESSTGNKRDALASLQINRQPASAKSGRWWKAILCLAVVGAAGYFLCDRYVADSGVLGDNAKWVPEIMQNREEVRLQKVKIKKGRSGDAVVVATGYLGSHRQAGIGARAAGLIDKVLFEEGVKVTKGQLLAELDHKDLDASLSASRASLARSKAAMAEQEITIEQTKGDLLRNQKLRKSRSISQAEYDQSRFAYKTALARLNSMTAEMELAQAQLQQAQQIRENMFIRAPFNGTIISKDAEVGESIMPGGLGGNSGRGSVATIADLDDLEIECDVQEDFIYRISNGQETEISVDAVPDKKYHGKVRMIIPMGDRARATIKVKVSIRDADSLLFPEMSGTVFFLPSDSDNNVESDKERIFCPTSSIDTNDSNDSVVWVVDKDSRAQSIVVQLGEEKDGETEVTDGLTGSERIIVRPPEALRDGSAVKIDQ